ncbi:AI-2E family transporter [Propioniciclava coleopterorum]|uniref:AI-2E family transporter n=1 Tax=Propioniciclava coleopterorum TaxID=2714937 RepID=A0A6G7Y429_9ACTN|nr:AI-2E family transporter [Propioniciclava coleopterorum]QIK71572.1 AI-2E family transporter [Propioniciclava coleopterorum]
MPVLVTLEQPEPRVPLEPDVPRGLTIAAGYALRFLVLGVFVVGLFMTLSYFSMLSVPLAIATLLAAMLFPIADRLRRWGWHPALAALTALLLLLLVVAGLLTFVGQQVAGELPSLIQQTSAGFNTFLAWLGTLPFNIDSDRLTGWLNEGLAWLQTQASALAGTAASVGAAFGSFFAGMATALVAAFFFAFQGRLIFSSAVNLLVPRAYRTQVDAAALRGWGSLVAYMRSAVIVAAVDAAGVALAAYLLGVPLVGALFALTFFLSFIPIVGAVLAGAVAVALALVTHGWVSALIMLGAVIAVMQLEGNFLQPLVMGKAVNVHPLAVLVGITAGGIVSGILGALLAIPLLAFSVAFVGSLRGSGSSGGPDSDDADPLPPEGAATPPEAPAAT